MRVKKDMHVKSDTHITNDTRITIDLHGNAKCASRAVRISVPAHRQRFTRVIA